MSKQDVPPTATRSKGSLRHWIREPLLHFLLLGCGIFVAYSVLFKGEGDAATRKITMTQGEIASLAEVFRRSWQRPPSPDELAGLVRERVREEVYAREAMALGLQKDDTVIRRRLAQKMEFVLDDVANQVQPTDAELAAYLSAHPQSFGNEQLFTFQQVFLDPQKHGKRLLADAAKLRLSLDKSGVGADVSAMGDPFLLEHAFKELPSSEIARQFGKEFPVKLAALSLNEWHEVESGYGIHLVRIAQRTEAGVPPLDEVRELVRREYGNERRLEANAKTYQKMLSRYSVSLAPEETVAPNKPKGSQAQ